MKLLPHEKSILYRSYIQIAAAGPELTALFYEHLFECDPSLRPLFKAAIVDQGVKWRMMLNMIIRTIDNSDQLQSSLRDLGRRHVDYGVKASDYPVFIESVLWAFKHYLGDEYTPEVDAAWHKLFALITEYAV